MLDIRSATILCLASLLAFSAIQADAAVNPIEIKGAKLFDSVTKEQFFIKGLVMNSSMNAL
jgi:hypothetical protein